MCKKINLKYIIFVICLFITEPVYAAPYVMAKECKDIFDPEVLKFLQQIYNVFKYLAPVLVLVFSTMDFVKAAASQDKEALKKAAKTALKRALLAILLFVVPTLLNYFFNLLGFSGTCGIE